MIGILLLLAISPVDLAPGAPALQAEADRLENLLVGATATQVATLRLQTRWTSYPTPKTPCENPSRLEIGWRTERFGAAWRESVQAVMAQAERLERVRTQPTVAPLIDQRWSTALDGLQKKANEQQTAFLEASAWQATFVRPVLAACPLTAPKPADGVAALDVVVRDASPLPVAILAIGEGYICPGLQPAESAVVLVRSGRACWSATDDCSCDIRLVEPGAILGPPPDGEILIHPETSDTSVPATDTLLYGSAKQAGDFLDPEVQMLPPEAFEPPLILPEETVDDPEPH